MNLVTGNEHDEWGLVSTQAPNRRHQMNKRFRKIELAHDLLPKANRGGVKGASIGILSIGMVCGAVRESVERLEKEGVDIEILEPRTVWPVLDETKDFINSHERTYIVELNFEGQLARIITGQGVAAEKIRSIRKVVGKPYRPHQLVEEILEREKPND
jgi:2-oxoglutarate ferredoxin oxidoreductase subunit alpha